MLKISAYYLLCGTQKSAKIPKLVAKNDNQAVHNSDLILIIFHLFFAGWAPTRRLRDVIWGLNSLFTDLLNFDDPLNIAAAEHYQRDKDAFRLKTKQWVAKYAKR